MSQQHLVQLRDTDYLLDTDANVEVTMSRPLHIHLLKLNFSTRIPIVIRKISHNDHFIYIAPGSSSGRSSSKLRDKNGGDMQVMVIGQHGPGLLRLSYDAVEDVWHEV